MTLKGLYQIIAAQVSVWRTAEYEGSEFPAIAEILEYQVERESGGRRFLRAQQIQALEAYWYLWLMEKTPRIIDLYRRLYPKKTDLIAALGVPRAAFEAVDFEMDDLWARILSDCPKRPGLFTRQDHSRIAPATGQGRGGQPPAPDHCEPPPPSRLFGRGPSELRPIHGGRPQAGKANRHEFTEERADLALSHLPAKKTDMVVGEYRLDVLSQPTNVAVKIIDMLGEEVLVVSEV